MQPIPTHFAPTRPTPFPPTPAPQPGSAVQDGVRREAAYHPEPTPPAEAAGTAEARTASRGAGGKQEDDGFSFWDFLDIINPLQHIPIVNQAYRALTGDSIDTPARLAGGLLFGGPVGLAANVVDIGVEQGTGRSIGGHLWAMVDGRDDDSAGSTPASVAETPDRLAALMADAKAALGQTALLARQEDPLVEVPPAQAGRSERTARSALPDHLDPRLLAQLHAMAAIEGAGEGEGEGQASRGLPR